MKIYLGIRKFDWEEAMSTVLCVSHMRGDPQERKMLKSLKALVVREPVGEAVAGRAETEVNVVIKSCMGSRDAECDGDFGDGVENQEREDIGINVRKHKKRSCQIRECRDSAGRNF
eukprot:c18758_g1_i1 orf=477-824(+)